MDTNTLITDLTKLIKIELMESIIVTALILTILLYIKSLIEAFVNYLLFRSNSMFAIGKNGTYVDVDGFCGKISKANVFWILIEGDDSCCRIETSKWRNSKWIILNTHCDTKKCKSCKEKDK
jgi:hypothetical protein